MRTFGRVTMIAGSLVTAIALATLQYANFGNGGETLWQTTTREPVIVTVVAIAAAALAVASLSADSMILPVLAAGCCFWLFGQLFYAGQTTYAGLKGGFWVPVVAAFIASIGGLFSVIGYRAGIPAAASRDAPPPRTAPAPAMPAPTTPPPGWYPDPSQPGRQRYWSGDSWTEQVHE
jgi:hypothetical protein